MSTVNNKKTIIAYILLLVVLSITSIGALVRYNLLDKHFTHLDDLIPGLLKKNKNKPLKYTSIETLKSNIKYADHIAQSSTNAPGQFLLTGYFLNSNDSYKHFLQKSRFPSFLFSLLSNIIVILICKTLFNGIAIEAAAISLSILNFSWMHIIYSVQSNSYAVGVFFLLVLILLILRIDNIPKYLMSIIFFLIPFIILFQYQLLIFVISFGIVWFFRKLKKGFKDNKEIISPLFLYQQVGYTYSKHTFAELVEGELLHGILDQIKSFYFICPRLTIFCIIQLSF